MLKFVFLFIQELENRKRAHQVTNELQQRATSAPEKPESKFK